MAPAVVALLWELMATSPEVGTVSDCDTFDLDWLSLGFTRLSFARLNFHGTTDNGFGLVCFGTTDIAPVPGAIGGTVGVVGMDGRGGLYGVMWRPERPEHL